MGPPPAKRVHTSVSQQQQSQIVNQEKARLYTILTSIRSDPEHITAELKSELQLLIHLSVEKDMWDCFISCAEPLQDLLIEMSTLKTNKLNDIIGLATALVLAAPRAWDYMKRLVDQCDIISPNDGNTRLKNALEAPFVHFYYTDKEIIEWLK